MRATNVFFTLGFIGIFACASHHPGPGPDSDAQKSGDGTGSTGTPFGVPGTDDAPTYSAVGDEKGNGGDAVVCFDNDSVRSDVKAKILANRGNQNPVNPFADADVLDHVASVQILDLYEYLLPSGMPPRVKPVQAITKDPPEALEDILARVAPKSRLADRLRETLATMPFDHWRASPGVIDIDDSAQAITLPGSCLLVQIAVRQETFVFYDSHLFSKLDKLGQLTLVLHELTYKLFKASNSGADNSRPARVAVGLMISKDEWEQTSAYELHQELLELANFAFPTDVKGTEVWVSTVAGVGPNDMPLKFDVEAPTEIVIGGNRYVVVKADGRSDKTAIERLADGTLVRLIGRPRDGDLGVDEHTQVGVYFAGDKMSRFIVYAGGGSLTWGTDVLNNPKGVDFDGDGHVKKVTFGDGSSSATGRSPSPYGNLNAHGDVTYYAGTHIPVAVNTLGWDVRTHFGTLGIDGAVGFHPNGEIAKLTNVRPETFRPYSLPTAVDLNAEGGDLTFFDNGDVATFVRAQSPDSVIKYDIQESTSTGTIRATFNDVISASFAPGNLLKEVVLGRNGTVFDNMQSPPVQKVVGAVTLQVDATGKIVTPF